MDIHVQWLFHDPFTGFISGTLVCLSTRPPGGAEPEHGVHEEGVRDQERPGFFTCCESRMRRYAAYVVIDFWAAWCGPCQMMAPEFAKAAAQAAGEALFIKVNTDEQQQIASQFRIQGIPAFALMRNGKVTAQTSGFQPAARLLTWMRQG